MIRIAICDDNELDALSARKVIRNALNELNKEAEIEYYLNAKDIQDKLLKKKESLDLLILDIDMSDISGLDLAESLRANNLKLLIIFLSNHEEFVFKAIEFQPFRYIRKIKLETEMPIAIRSAVILFNFIPLRLQYMFLFVVLECLFYVILWCVRILLLN